MRLAVEQQNILDEHPEEELSKTEIKRQMHALQVLGVKIAELGAAKRSKLPLNDRLQQAIDEFNRIKSNSARKRQMQYIGKLLRAEEDIEAVKQALARYTEGEQAHTQLFHQLERWRDRLINEGNNALQTYIESYPNADIQHLRQLIRNANKELKQQKPPASARKIFQYLRQMAELE